MPVPRNALLDLADGIGVRACEWRYYVVSDVREQIGQLDVLEPSQISASTGSNAKRTLGNLQAMESDVQAFNPFTDRIAPTMVLEDGTEWQCGEFHVVRSFLHVTDYANWMDLVLSDGDDYLGDELEATFSVWPGGNISEALNDLADMAGIMWREIPDTGQYIGPDPFVKPAGTIIKQVMTELCERAAWLPPFFNNVGTMVIKPAVALDDAIPDIVYGEDDRRILADSVVIENNMYSAPNIWRVKNNGPTQAEIVGKAEVDPSKPWSIEKRRRRKCKTVDAQGVSSSQAAEAMAVAKAQADDEAFKTITATTLADPRHDIFMVVNWRENLREVGWSMDLKPEAEMKHTWTTGGFQDE